MKKLEKQRYPFRMIVPALLIFSIFYMLSVVCGFFYSFTDWNSRYSEIHWIGFENFKALFTETQFLHALFNTFFYSVTSTLLIVFLSLILALLLNTHYRGRYFFRALFYFPSILTTLVVGYLFKFILAPGKGLISNLFSALGFEKLADVPWLGLELALPSIVGVAVWVWTGYNATLMLAGLQSVPNDLKEAARIDGANELQVFKHVVLPYLRPSFTLVITLNLIGGMKIFDLVVAMTNGGPIYATETLSTFLLKSQATGALGYSTAISTLQFLIITIICLPVLAFLKKREEILE